jgi:4a-hydroxytetrahydrobiopterin dehydratase
MAVLSDEEIRTRLQGLAGWEQAEGSITNEYRFDTFRQSVTFVVGLAFAAEAANHHPDLDIRYNRVRVTLSTHSEGGVTEKDLDLAAAAEGIAASSVPEGSGS